MEKARYARYRTYEKTGEYGEYFPAGITVFGYNETKAFDHFPLSKIEAIAKRF